MNVPTPKWNGLTEAYEVDMDCQDYRYRTEQSAYAAELQVHDGSPDHRDRRVVQIEGYASMPLPPFKSSTGLRVKPDLPNPYLSQRDASNAHGQHDCHADITDGMYPSPCEEWEPNGVPHDIVPPIEGSEAWRLSECDLQSMFVDYFRDEDEEYVSKMEIGLLAAQYDIAAEGQAEISEDESTYTSIAHVFQEVRAHESWTALDMAECEHTFHVEDVSAPEEELASEHDLRVMMVTDNRGRSTPLACGVMVVKDVAGRACSRLLRVLFDSGGSRSMIHKRVLPGGARVDLTEKQMFNTLAGAYASQGSVQLQGMRLPAFDKNRVIADHHFEVFDSDCRFDVILGADFLEKVGMNLRFEDLTIEWLGNTIPMETFNKTTDVATHIEYYVDELDAEELGFEVDECYLTTPILDAKYDKWTIDEVINEHCSHLTLDQQADMRALLARHSKLFDGTLGKYPGEPMHIELIPGAQPVYRRPYPVPQVHMQAFKKELDHLVEIGVLSPVRDTEWGLPTFITPKKDGRIRWVSDMRELNKVIKRTQYTLPIIKDVLQKRKGYEFLTKLDISMQYYTFELDDESKKLCTIVTPYGPFCYNRVAMGLCNSPGFAQARMEEVLRGILDADVYIDDIGVFSQDWNSHISVLGEVLQRLEENGFTINPLKCEWGVKETDWLGYWLTPTGLRPWAKKVDAIMKMQPPTNASELRTFLGMITYYRDMWPRRSHVLAPFTSLSGLPKKTPIRWTKELDIAFRQMKAVIAEDALMAYPDHNAPFEIYTDASDYQLGACIMQNKRPVAYYSKKLSAAQKNYTTMEKELLAIVMTLREFRSMLLGAEINIFTDHRNLTYSTFNTQRVLRWRCFIEEYSPNMFYLEGKLNVLADAFSRLPRFDDVSVAEGKRAGADMSPVPLAMHYNETELYDCLRHLPEMDSYFSASATSFDGVTEFYTGSSYLNLPSSDENPLSYRWLKEMQDSDLNLERRSADSPYYSTKTFDEIELVCYTEPGKDADNDWKICLSDEALDPAIRWFHQVLGHPGRERLIQGMDRYYHPNLRQRIGAYRCDACQRYKTDGRGHGQLPARDVRAAPWEQVDVDLIGPWKLTTVTNRTYEFNALTSIDRVTGLAELIRIDDKTSAHITDKFVESWLSRYPRPFACCHDNGGEFSGWEFQKLMHDFGVRDVPTTSRNPTANGICERMHQTVANVLKTKIQAHPPRTLGDARALVDEALATASHAIRSNVSQVTGYSPGALAFHRDMFLDVPLVVDLMAIRERRQLAVDANLRRVNAKRTSYDYQVGQKVLKKRHEWSKLGEKWDGPFSIERVHVNGNITIAIRDGVTERLNIRRVKPYHEPTVPPTEMPPNPVVPTEPVSRRLRSSAPLE